MKYMVAGHEATSADEFVALAFGIDRELFAGVSGENESERAARLDAARDILVDLNEIDPEAARFAAELLRAAPVPLRRTALLSGGIPRSHKSGAVAAVRRGWAA